MSVYPFYDFTAKNVYNRQTAPPVLLPNYPTFLGVAAGGGGSCLYFTAALGLLIYQ